MKEILRQTSRSFYLTLRLLPRPVRADITLGYLLARATDAVADASAADPERKLEMLRAARDDLGREAITGYAPETWAALQRHPAESRLLAALPALWRRMHGLDTPARERLAIVMGHILEGQIFDLERFTPGAAPLTGEELERYTYLVAGSVGEFWTELCAERLRRFAGEPSGVMLAWARHYGQALQLVNILRDRRADAALGRIYMREEDVPRWIARARAWLDEGARYCAALYSGRLRCATLLPILLGLRTLTLVETRPLTPCKVPRAETRKWVRHSLAAWWSAKAVERLVRKARVRAGQ